MVVLLQSDYMEVKLSSLIADYDRDTLTNLYQPIVGYQAIAVYMTLWSEANNEKITSPCTHGQLFNRMKIAPGVFVDARKALEAVGLVKTFLLKEGDSKFYHYELYAPKTPRKFFDDALLFGMLIKVLGDTDANRFKSIYHYEIEKDIGKDISSTFVEVFNPDFDDPAFFKAMSVPSSTDRVTAKVLTQFSWENFINAIKEISQISDDAFTKKDMKEIERLATLNGVNEKETANAVALVYDAYAPKGKHIDFEKLAKMLQDQATYVNTRTSSNKPSLNSGKTALAKKINLMETSSPKKYLYILQNGTQPASSDLMLIDDLSKKFNLKPGVINALVDYTLASNNNVLSRAYCEKVAASLAREGVETAYDTMEYLRSIRNGTKTSKISERSSYKKECVKEPQVEEQVDDKKENQSSSKEEDINWKQLLDDIDEGGSNGKA